MLVRLIALTLLLAGCATHPLAPTPEAPLASRPVELLDTLRQRPVPVVLYSAPRVGRPKPLAIISHGYGGHSTDYTFIASALTRLGFIVASIDHLERPGDPAMANSGNLAELRRPVWQIGADSIGFVISELRRQGLADRERVVLVGHSNGGDMTMLFSYQRPGDVQAAFSLDHRRMPVPRTAQPRICSARSNDYVADPGVLPTVAERDALGMLVTEVPVKHNDMSDSATPQQQQAILEVLTACLDGLLFKQAN
jgi:predicted esterase